MTTTALLTPAEVAVELKLAKRTVQEMMRDGRLPCYRVIGESRKRYRMSREQLQMYLDGKWVKPQEKEKPKPRAARAGFPLMEKYGYR